MTELLPEHGRIACMLCHNGQQIPGEAQTSVGTWRITNNPLAWGSREPEVIVLGFSKGPTQAGAANGSHDEIAYKGGRTNVAKILHHIGLLPRPDGKLVDALIADRNGRFHFGSLIRCTVERYDSSLHVWKGTGGGMLDRFLAEDFGRMVAGNCSKRFLEHLPARTRLIVMMGMGTRGNYIQSCRRLLQSARPVPWRTINEVSYTDSKVVVVHTEHFASQGALLPNWLSGSNHERGRLGLMAREAVQYALAG